MHSTFDEIELEFKTRVTALLLSRGEQKDTGVSNVRELYTAELHILQEQAYGASSIGLIVWPLDYSACGIYQDGPGDTRKRNYPSMEAALPALRALMVLEDLADV